MRRLNVHFRNAIRNRHICLDKDIKWISNNNLSVISYRTITSSQITEFKISQNYYFSDQLNKNASIVNEKIAKEIPPPDAQKIRELLEETNNLKQVKQNENKKLNILLEENDTNKVVDTKKLSIVQKIKNEFIHYYHGFKLLGLDIKICVKLLYNMCKGHTLTRRERKQLVRTVADIFRVFPFAVFIAVPFMEFLLPLYIKFFPFLMPSTFQTQSAEVQKHRQLLKGKLELAKFLQDTLEESKSNSLSENTDINLETFNQFMKQVRESGHMASTKDILKFTRFFEDEVTLESLDAPLLKALCKLLELNSVGPKALLVFQLKMRVRQLKADDQMIANEGIDSLPDFELITLCRERGMRAIGVSKDRLQFQLRQWLKLSIRDKVPISLLLLSRTMYFPVALSSEEQLTKTILVLPQSVSKEASLKTSKDTKKYDNKTKFDIIKNEDKAIKLEREEIRKQKEKLVDKAPIVTTEIQTDIPTKKVEPKSEKENSISAADLNQIESAIESMNSSQTAIEEDFLDEIKKETVIDESDAKSINKSSKNIHVKLGSIIGDIDSLIEKFNVQKQTIQQDMNAHDKKYHKENDEKCQIETDEKCQLHKTKQDRLVKITDVMESLRQLKSAAVHNDEEWQKILSILDEDHDGQIEVHHIAELLDMIGYDNQLEITSKQMARLLDAIDKEDVIDQNKDRQTNTA